MRTPVGQALQAVAGIIEDVDQQQPGDGQDVPRRDAQRGASPGGGTGGETPASARPQVRDVDVVVLGGGSGAETAGPRAVAAGRSVVVVEGDLVGGECPFRACVPSKAVLRAAHGHRAAGDGDHEAAWRLAVRRRDEATNGRDDGDKAAGLAEDGVELVRGWGRATSRDAAGGGLVEVQRDGAVVEVLRWRTLVVGTGSSPSRPPVEGLDDVPTWTSDQALTSDHRPRSLVVLGGGPVGCELSQVYASFGVRTVLVETAPGLLPGEQPAVGDAVEQALRGSGVDVRTGVTAQRARPHADGLVLELDDGSELVVERVLLASGRRARTEALVGLGLDTTEKGALVTDARYRTSVGGQVLDDVLAVGDVTGRVAYTHGANYQARVVADALAGSPRDGDETGIPRAVYTDPPAFCTGLSQEAAREAGHEVVVASWPSTGTGRAHVQRYDGPGCVEVVVDVASRVVLGAAVVAPEADSWAGELALAVRTRMTVDTLAEAVHAFPSWSELVQPVAEDVLHQLQERGTADAA